MAAQLDSTGHDSYPLRTVAQRTGLSADLIRAWEKRYGVVKPIRGPRGARLYSAADITRLQVLASAVAAGRSIGDVARLDPEHLNRLATSDATNPSPLAPFTEPPQARAANPERTIAAILDCVGELDLLGLEQQLSDALTALGSRSFLRTVVAPVLELVGDGWTRGEVSIAQEHFISATLRNMLTGMMRTRRNARPPSLLLATSSGERHEFGLLLTALTAHDIGVGIAYLGADTPAEEIASAALSLNCRVVGIGTVTSEQRDSATKTVRLLDRRLPANTELWLGGRDAVSVHARVRTTRAKVITNLNDLEQELRRIEHTGVHLPRKRSL